MSESKDLQWMFEGKEPVRAHLDDQGNPGFVAKDVCDILKIQNPSDTIKKVLDENEKGVDQIYTLGGPQKKKEKP